MNTDLSQYQIAKESGVSAGIISRFVHGQRFISLETAEKLCTALGLELTEKEKQE